MSNFIEEFKRGQSESVRGIPFGKGLENITLDTNGISKGRMYGIAGPEKSGKSTFADYAFILQPYLYCLEHKLPINWVYYSFEIDRVSKEFDFMAFFLNNDYKVNNITLPEGVTRRGKNKIPLSPDYLRGFMMDDNNNPIRIHPELIPLIRKVYEERLVPLFREYSAEGVQLKKGLIEFIERKENPTGINKHLVSLAEKKGTLLKDSNGNWISYTPNDPNLVTIVVLDHIRKVKLERGWQIKQVIDKTSEYFVDLRNIFGYTIVPIIHTNRNLGSVDRLKHFKQDLYPTSDDLKDSGNIGEDCNFLFTVFNPNEDKYGLKEHFGLVIRDSRDNLLYPNLRTIHLVSSRHCEFPRHYKVGMVGNVKKFETIK